MILVRARYKSKMADIVYDPVSDGGVEVLELLVSSMFDQLSEPLLVDFAGRRITTSEDIEDIKVVELIPESLQGSLEEVLEHGDDAEWGQHHDLLSSTNALSTTGDGTKGGGELVRATTVVNVWAVDRVDLQFHRFCTSTIFNAPAPVPVKTADTDTNKGTVVSATIDSSDSCILQPVHRITDTTFLLCTRCAQMVSSDLMQRGGDRLVKFACSGQQVLEIGLGWYFSSSVYSPNYFS